MTYEFAPLNGTKLHCEARGDGRAVFLLHAGVTNLHMWDDQMPALSERFRVIRFDFRGWGESVDPPGTYSPHDDLRRLMDYYNVERASLVGSSFGGAVALDFALTWPERTEKLVLVGPGLGGYEFTHEGFEDKRETLIGTYQRDEKDISAELWAQIWYDGMGRTAEQVDAQTRQRAYDMMLHILRLPDGEGDSQMLDPPAMQRLAEIQAPALLIVGDCDVPDVHKIAGILEASVSGLRRVSMPNTAHLPNMEWPEEFNRLVIDFLQ